MGKIYYKYLPIQRITYLDDELLRFTQPSALNDPFECLPQKPSVEDMENIVKAVRDRSMQRAKSLEELEFYLKELAKLESNIKSGIKGNLVDTLYYDAHKNIDKEIGVLSLSKTWCNTVMWAHYSYSHSGFCLGFNPKHPYFQDFLSADRKTSKIIGEVQYSSKRVKIKTDFQHKPLGLEPFFTKSIDWKYEEEVRIVATLDLSQKIIKNEPNNICLFKVPHSAITEIILGAKMDKTKENIIKEFCLNNKIRSYKCKISETNFDMERG